MSKSIFIVFVFASCTLLMPKEKRECYRTLKDFADENWEFTNNDSILIENEDLFRIARGDDKIDSCAKKMTRKDIERIFGKPHDINTINSGVTQYYYFTFESCYPSINETRFCTYYAFDFDQQGQCINFLTGGVERSH